MSLRLAEKLLLLPLGLALVAPVQGQQPTVPQAPAEVEVPAVPVAVSNSAPWAPVKPGPADGLIASVTARLLEQSHYLRQAFDDSVSSKFLDRYIESFDPQHLHFLQSDLAEFERYRTNLDNLTLQRRRPADTHPASEIFNRFYTRLEARVAYVDELLAKEKFTFDGDDRILVNRKDLPYPNDLDEAKALWRERLRFEYLQERLTKLGAKKKSDAGSKSTPAEAKPATKAKNMDQEIVDTLQHRYHRNLKLFKDFDSDDVIQVYLTALAQVYDPHSDYMGRAQLESFAIGMNLSLFGIGAELRSEDGYCTINRLLPGGPAVKSRKVKEKDRIIAVAQSNAVPVDVIDMNLSKAVQLIRGPKGTEVRLTIIPAGEDASSAKVVSLMRDEIPLEDQAAKAKLIEVPQNSGEALRFGVIDLPSFYAPFEPGGTGKRAEPKSTTVDVSKLLRKLKEQKVRGIILDLRRNGGGSLEEAIKLTGLFIKEGPVVQVRDTSGKTEVDMDEDPTVEYDGPLVVLTSRFSASASEILAGALQDYGRALIVGDAATHGKGTVQSVNHLQHYVQMLNPGLTNNPGALKVTIKKFYRASGASTQLKGVSPDLLLPSVVSESKDFGEGALENPLPWDTIETSKFEHLNLVAPYLAELQKLSAARIGADPEFAYIREDIGIYKKQQADKTVSLNERQRLKEKEEVDARQKARDKERLARPEPNQKVYELTVKAASEPGLPPPMAKTNTVSKGEVKGEADGSPTNQTSVAKAEEPAADLDEESGEEKHPTVDAIMVETQRILGDYVALLSQHNLAATTPSPVPQPERNDSQYGLRSAAERQ